VIGDPLDFIAVGATANRTRRPFTDGTGGGGGVGGRRFESTEFQPAPAISERPGGPRSSRQISGKIPNRAIPIFRHSRPCDHRENNRLLPSMRRPKKAKELGLQTSILGTELEGEAKDRAGDLQ